MPISTSTLSALQKVGAAAFAADDKLKKEIGLYAQRVNTAVFSNPYSLGNDALIESWKVVARLSKTLSGIEEELRNLYRTANELAEDDQPSVRETPALAAPTPAPVATKKASKSIVKAVDLTATTVKVKKAAKKQAPKAAAPAAKTTAKSEPKVAATPAAKDKKTVAKPLAAKKVATPAALPTKAVKKAVVTTVKAEVATPAKTKPIAKATKVKAPKAATPTQELAANPAKLLAHLQTILNTEAFEHLNQTVLFKETGIPLGSIGATLGRLTKAGRLVAGPQGSYKLASAPVKAAAAEKSAPVQPEVPSATPVQQA
jgi:hypothetical protein